MFFNQKTPFFLLFLSLFFLLLILFQISQNPRFSSIPSLDSDYSSVPSLDSYMSRLDLSGNQSFSNISMNFSLITEAKLLLMQLKAEVLNGETENNKKFEPFLINFKGKLTSFIFSLQEIKKAYLENEEIKRKLDISIEESLKCKTFLYGNRSLLENHDFQHKSLENEIQSIYMEITDLNSKKALSFIRKTSILL
jgi:hypothetical protein